jgi:hypothetical protein
MSRHQNDPLRPLTADHRTELARLSESPSTPAAGGRLCPHPAGDCQRSQLHRRLLGLIACFVLGLEL